MAVTLVERRAGWALPPRPPEKWVGGRWLAGLLVLSVVVTVLALLPVRTDESGSALAVGLVHAGTAVASLVTAYFLLLQASVTGDARLRWVGAGFAALVPLVLLRVLSLSDDADRVVAEDDRAAVLTVLLLVVVPGFALTARRSLWGLLVPLDVATLVTLVALLSPVALVTDDLRSRPGLRALALLAVALALVAAAVWHRRSPYGRHGAWGWGTASLGVLGLAGLLHAASADRYDALWWTGTGGQLVAVVLPALGLSLFCSAGYRRQSRRWRQLVHEVSTLRAASPLLPGLSVTPEDDEGLPGRREVQALIDDVAVKVALQPVVRLEDGAVLGYEALSRFGGRVRTDRWFRGATLHGLGGELERVTLQAALALLPQLPDEVFLAVNVSPAALEDAQVLALLEAADLARVVVEVTEHEAVADYSDTRRRLQRMREAGARIAVDDTGAGFASLRHVLMLQPDIIKLDTSLTRDVQNDKNQQRLVSALLTFAREVGSLVLSEGIETEEQLQELRRLGVPLGQGWHLGVPQVVT